jgi:hypothetical protein
MLDRALAGERRMAALELVELDQGVGDTTVAERIVDGGGHLALAGARRTGDDEDEQRPSRVR